MKRFLIYLTITFLFCISSVAQSNHIVSPVWLGMLLIEEPSVEKMAATCEYYNLFEGQQQDDFYVFSHPDGTVIKFKVDYVGDKKFPTVKLTTRDKSTSVDKILSNSGYRKVSDGYVKGTKFEHRRTRCRVSTGGARSTLTFTKEYNSLE